MMAGHLLSYACLAAAGYSAFGLALLLWDGRLLRRAAARARSSDLGQAAPKTWQGQWQEAQAWALDALEARLPRRAAGPLQAWLQGQAAAPRLGAFVARSLGWGLGSAAVLGALDLRFGLLAGALGLALPWLQLRDAARRRLSRLRRALPDAADLLCACVQAGQGLDQALQRATAQLGPGPLRQELSLALAQMQAGSPRKEAFAALAQRCALPELAPLLKAILRSEARGVALAPVLKAQSGQLRRLWSLRVQKAAAQAPVKMLFPLLLFILPAVFLVVFGPILIQLTELGL